MVLSSPDPHTAWTNDLTPTAVRLSVLKREAATLALKIQSETEALEQKTAALAKAEEKRVRERRT